MFTPWNLRFVLFFPFGWPFVCVSVFKNNKRNWEQQTKKKMLWKNGEEGNNPSKEKKKNQGYTEQCKCVCFRWLRFCPQKKERLDECCFLNAFFKFFHYKKTSRFFFLYCFFVCCCVTKKKETQKSTKSSFVF